MLAGAGALRGTVGLVGLLVVLAVCITPFLRLALQYLVYKAHRPPQGPRPGQHRLRGVRQNTPHHRDSPGNSQLGRLDGGGVHAARYGPAGGEVAHKGQQQGGEEKGDGPFSRSASFFSPGLPTAARCV